MDAEIQFFMTEKDEADFLDFVKVHIDEIENHGPQMKFRMGDCELLFSASVMQKNKLYIGRLEIRLGNPDENFESAERAKTTFRKLRNWIKKNYYSRLAYLNKKKKDKLTPSRVHWLGPDAKKWKQKHPEHNELRLSKTSWMIFEIGV